MLRLLDNISPAVVLITVCGNMKQCTAVVMLRLLDNMLRLGDCWTTLLLLWTTLLDNISTVLLLLLSSSQSVEI